MIQPPPSARSKVLGDYLVTDYLAEITAPKPKANDPEAGYFRDLLMQMRDVFAPALERPASELGGGDTA
jgi:hypothetical protein